MYERNTALQINHVTPHCAKPLLAAALLIAKSQKSQKEF